MLHEFSYTTTIYAASSYRCMGVIQLFKFEANQGTVCAFQALLGVDDSEVDEDKSVSLQCRRSCIIDNVVLVLVHSFRCNKYLPIC